MGAEGPTSHEAGPTKQGLAKPRCPGRPSQRWGKTVPCMTTKSSALVIPTVFHYPSHQRRAAPRSTRQISRCRAPRPEAKAAIRSEIPDAMLRVAPFMVPLASACAMAGVARGGRKNANATPPSCSNTDAPLPAAAYALQTYISTRGLNDVPLKIK